MAETSQNVDTLLQVVAEISDRYGLGPDVTLFVGGIILSGQIVPAKMYLQETGHQLGVATALAGLPKVGEAITKVFNKLSDGARATKDEDPESIHLQNVIIHSGATTIELPWWRGKLSAVDGFTFGRLKDS